jgi:hypothetical protein
MFSVAEPVLCRIFLAAIVYLSSCIGALTYVGSEIEKSDIIARLGGEKF